MNYHNTGGANWLLHPQLLRCSWLGTFFCAWNYWIWNACVFLTILVQIEHTLSDQRQHYWATAVQFYVALWGYVIKWDRYWHILKFPHFTDDWNEIDRMEESFDRLWKIEKLLEILYSIFSKVYGTSNDQAAENLFFSSAEKQFSNNILLRNVSAWKRTNCATPQVTFTTSKCTWGRTDNAQPNSWQQHMPRWHNCLQQ